MTDQRLYQEGSGKEQNRQRPEDEEVSLRDLFLTLWRYRKAIVLWSLASILLIFVCGGSLYLLQGKTSRLELKFKLQFDGIEDNEYPNGLKFSTSDILANPVLNEVYTINNLDKYIGLSDFKAALAITQTNDKLKFLEYEYNAKLSNSKLTVEERDKLEAEFREKKQNALVPIYTLSLSLEERLPTIPSKVTSKVLRDILKTWADYADRVKGALKYRMAVVSRNIIDKESLENEEYIVVLDVLRKAIDRVQEDTSAMKKIPGSSMVKIGEDDISLSDLDYRMEFIKQFKLSPLSGIIRQTGVAKNKEIATGYLENKLFELELQENEIKAKKEIYDGSLQTYLAKGGDGSEKGSYGPYPGTAKDQREARDFQAMIPQFGSTFLNSLMELGKEQSDAEFRQEITRKAIESGIEKVTVEYDARYYRNQLEIIEQFESGSSESVYYQTALSRIKKIINEVYSDLMQSIDEVNAIYLALSEHNLNPGSQLYSVLQPVIQKDYKPLKPFKLLLFMIFAVILAEGMILFGVLIANSVSKRREV